MARLLQAQDAKAKAIDGDSWLSWVRLDSWPALPPRCSRSLSVVDLFCSCGCLTLGIWEGARQRAMKLDVRLAVDTAKEPLNVYKTNFRSKPGRIRCDDVTRLFGGGKFKATSSVERHWKGKVGDLDLLVAGPPCQGHSDLNNSTRRNDPRNDLYLRVARATEVLEPRVVIIENVPQVLLDQGRAVPRTIGWLERIGYSVSEAVIRLCRFGIPQLRKRHILVAAQNGPFSLSELDDVDLAVPHAGAFIAGLQKEDRKEGIFYRPGALTELNRSRVDYLFDKSLYDLPNSRRPSCHRDKAHAYVSSYGRIHWDKPAQTLTSGFGSMGQGRYVHPRERRLLTPHEAARLQGLPDFFDFSAAITQSKLRAMIANAVPPQFTAALITRLIDKGLL